MPEVAPAQIKSEKTQADASTRLVKRFRQGAVAAAFLIGCFGLVEIVGWILDVETIKRPFGLMLIQSGTCIEFLFVSIALLLFDFGRAKWMRILARVVAGVVLIAAGLNWVEHTFELDLSLVYPLWQPVDAAPLSFPGPIAPDVALNFIGLGLALALYDVRIKNRIDVWQVLGLMVALPNLMILSCYAAGVPTICAFFGCVRFAVVTSGMMTIAALGLLFSKPDRGMISIVSSATIGGRLLRSICVGLLATAPLLALIRAGEVHGLYDQPISYGMMGLMVITLLGTCIAWGAKKMDTIEAEKTHVVQLLRDSIISQSKAPAAKTLKAICFQCDKQVEQTDASFCPDCGGELTLIADKLKKGTIFAESYEVMDFIGAGGIGNVYLVKHMLMEKHMALKLIHGHFATEPRYVHRFRHEAKSMSRLSHQNVVTVHDFGVSMDGQAYLIMDYLDGTSLAEKIEAFGAIAWGQAVPIFVQICQGLKHAHSQGIVHRDLKPANVMLIDDPEAGRVAKIVDFGLAKVSEASVALTKSGELLGSPTYMSPEQCRGEVADERSDIYSFGALMYECLVGQPHIINDNIYETIMMQVSEPTPPLDPRLGVPSWLEACVMKCMEKQQDHRFQSVTNVLEALYSGLQQETHSRN
jgi:hypothetical protein